MFENAKGNVQNNIQGKGQSNIQGNVQNTPYDPAIPAVLTDADVERLAALHDQIIASQHLETEIPWKVTRRDLERSVILLKHLIEAEECNKNPELLEHDILYHRGCEPNAIYSIGIRLAWEEIRLPVFDYPRDENGRRDHNAEKFLNPAREAIAAIESSIGYSFFNEWLLYQSLIRRDYASDIREPGDYETLEHIGDTAISYVLERCMLDQYTNYKSRGTIGGLNHRFFCDVNEGQMSEIKSHYSSKDHLSLRCKELGIDRFILYGQNDKANGVDRKPDAKEDVMEAIIGAVAIDCRWDYGVLGSTVERMLDVHLDYDAWQKSWDLYKKVNAWCQRNEGKAPAYSFTTVGEMEAGVRAATDLTEEEKAAALDKIESESGGDDIKAKVTIAGQTFTGWGVTRSKARSRAAEDAYHYLYENGLWLNLKDMKIVPSIDTAINTLQELRQKGYIEEAEYEFDDDGDQWTCICRVGQFWDEGVADDKKSSKKKAAYGVLLSVLESAGACKPEWWDEYEELSGC